ncbi:MAG: hypothetical protein ABI679_06965, partial [Gemmatimonadota bacterium]
MNPTLPDTGGWGFPSKSVPGSATSIQMHNHLPDQAQGDGLYTNDKKENTEQQEGPGGQTAGPDHLHEEHP